MSQRDTRSAREQALGFVRARKAAGEAPSASAAEPAMRRRPPPAFEALPEFQEIEAHRLTGAQFGIDDLFYRPHEAAAGARSRIEGRELVNFASYDYLGLNRDPRLIEAAKAALDQFAVSASASRLVGGERTIHAALESRIAGLYGVEAALTFVSGYLTNVAAIGCLMGPDDLVIHDEFIHNSALAGIRLSGAARRLFRHNDLASLRQVLETAGGHFRRVLVIVEGVYSMDGDIPDLPALIELRQRYGFWLMLDEAHALGVLGPTGRGTCEHFGLTPQDVDIFMGTLSKTTSACGGYIAGSAALIAILKANAGGFVYSVGLAPVLAAAALTSLETMQAEPERVARLRENGAFFRDAAQAAGLDTGHSAGYSVVPVIVGDSVRAAKLSKELFEDGINVLPIIHPAVPEGLARLRFFITSEHTKDEMLRAVEATAARLEALEAQGFGVKSVDISAIADIIGRRGRPGQ